MNTNSPFRKKLEKLFCSQIKEDKYIGIALIEWSLGVDLKKIAPSLLYNISKGKVSVLKDTSNNQIEIVIGKWGITIRKITLVQASGTIIYWI